MRYAGNYRLTDNPRTKMSHRLRALLKRRSSVYSGGKVPTDMRKEVSK